MWPKYLGVKSLLTLEGLNGIGMCWFGLELVVLLMVEAGVKCRHGTEEFFFFRSRVSMCTKIVLVFALTKILIIVVVSLYGVIVIVSSRSEP
jgi:hypothetical protein